MGIETVRGKQVVIRFDGQRCVHSRYCVLGHPDVFVPNVDGEWIHPDAVSAEEVAFTARSCPSGAIQYERLDGGPQEPAPVVNTVRRANMVRSRSTHRCASPARTKACARPCAVAAYRRTNLFATTATPKAASMPPASRRRRNPSLCRRATVRSPSNRRKTGRSRSPETWKWSAAPGIRSTASPKPGSAVADTRRTSRIATAPIARSDSRPPAPSRRSL